LAAPPAGGASSFGVRPWCSKGARSLARDVYDEIGTNGQALGRYLRPGLYAKWILRAVFLALHIVSGAVALALGPLALLAAARRHNSLIGY
jgi:hypothetical protein